jgi:hypothetical protein
MELEAKYSNDIFDFSINHTYTKQINWDLNDSIKASGISFSEYRMDYDPDPITGKNRKSLISTGNNLSNWSNNSTKAILNMKLFDGELALNADAHVFWKFEGYKDGLLMIENSIGIDTDSLSNILNKSLEKIKNIDYGGLDFRLNLSITYSPTKHFSITGQVMNMLNYGGSKRYTYSAGEKNPDSVFRFGFVEEPMTFFIRLTTRL